MFNKKGSALLFVIVGITLAAVLGVGMFYMTSTSTTGQVSGSAMNRAYYLAMAGKDYALANWQPNNGEYIISNTENFDIDINNEIVTGIVNKNTPFEARKEIEINSFGSSPVKRHFKDSFDDTGLPNWNKGAPAEVGSHEVSGDNALDVISSAAAFGSGTWSFLKLKTGGSGVGINITPSWLNAGRCLSYDLQVKIKNNLPYYMAGLNFKVAGSGDDREFYGVSFIRGKRKFNFLTWKWESDDGAPIELKPEPIFSTIFSIISNPAIILWKKQGSNFTWLAYKLLTDADFVVDSSSNLVDWSNLQVRLIEAYPLDFTTAGTSSTYPLVSGAVVKGATSGATARLSGTPVITSGSWASSDVVGILTLTNISGTFTSGENLLVSGTVLAKASGTQGTKTNFIRAYFADVNSHGTLNNIPTDSDNRGGNLRIVTGSELIHWPTDNVSDWKAENDFMTLVQWDGVQASASILGGSGTMEENAIIKDSSLLTPPPPDAIDYSGIALHATGWSATSTYFDDFAVQY